nr:hypothetical protein [Tanacetum cinerariifolium]
MKTIFEELETEIDQNVVNRKCDEIKQKNLLISNDTLIANCLSNEVFHIATNSELNVSRFYEMHDAHTVVQARYLELETELSKLKDKIQKDDHDFMDGPDFDSVFEIKKMKASIQGKSNAIRKLRMQISQLQETRSEANRTLDFRALDFQITQLTKKVSVLQEQNELFRVENAKVKQNYKELYDSIKITCAKHINQTTTLLTENENLNVQINAKLKCVTIDFVTPKVLAPDISKPRSNTKKNKILPARSINKKTVEDHSRTNKSHFQKPNRVDSSISSKRIIINSNYDFVCQTCKKCFILANHDMCVIKCLNSVNAPSSGKNVVRKVKQVWKATGTVLTTVVYQWKPM